MVDSTQGAPDDLVLDEWPVRLLVTRGLSTGDAESLGHSVDEELASWSRRLVERLGASGRVHVDVDR